MLTTELRTHINSKWDACWPINNLKPLVLLDLLSYLFFIKKLDENQLLSERYTLKSEDHLIYAKEQNMLQWSRLKDMDVQDMLTLFTREKGIPYLLHSYGNTTLQYSMFVKEPLLITPTTRLLANMMDILKMMEKEDTITRAHMFDYLLFKAEIVAQNGQVYAPYELIKLIVALMQPTVEDVIGDPSAGNAGFLLGSARYIANNTGSNPYHLKSAIDTEKIKGIECDLIQLRIGAMNMILNGIDDPKLEGVNVLDNSSLNLRQQPTLILSNLFFKNPEEKITEEDPLQIRNRRPEVSLLSMVVKNLKPGGRAAVIIREMMLLDNVTEIKNIRRQIIDFHKLEAVISLNAKNDSLFSGACILIFTRQEPETNDKAWFYKTESFHKMGGPENYNWRPVDHLVDFTFAEENEFQEIISRWELWKKRIATAETEKSFYVPINEIRENNYNLNFSHYKMRMQEGFNQKTRVVHKKRRIKKQRSKARLVIFGILIPVICVAVISYFLYFNHGKKNFFSFLSANKGRVDSISAAPADKSIPLKISSAAAIISKDGYTVINKAYFYAWPAENYRKKIFLSQHNNIVLHPMDEKNGFIYVVYINRSGQSTKGWLNKKDLSPIKQ